MGLLDRLLGRPSTAPAVPTSIIAAPSWLQRPTLLPGADLFVVGESHYQDALELIAGGRTENGGRHTRFTAQLVREPTNPYDRNAVRVDIGGLTVGYVARDEAPDMHHAIEAMAREGAAATCRATLTGGWDRGGADRGHFGVVLDAVRPLRRCASDFPFLPSERKVAVIGEETFQNALSHLRERGHRHTAALALSANSTVRVKIDDFEVGRLSDAMSARYADLVRSVLAVDEQPTCVAVLSTGAKKIEVNLELPAM